MTKDQAVKMYRTGWWEDCSFESIAKFQVLEPRLCCPFEVFHEAMEEALEREVYGQEFGNSEDLIKELFLGESVPSDPFSCLPDDVKDKVTAVIV